MDLRKRQATPGPEDECPRPGSGRDFRVSTKDLHMA